jgi:hypothetical protein
MCSGRADPPETITFKRPPRFCLRRDRDMERLKDSVRDEVGQTVRLMCYRIADSNSFSFSFSSSLLYEVASPLIIERNRIQLIAMHANNVSFLSIPRSPSYYCHEALIFMSVLPFRLPPSTHSSFDFSCISSASSPLYLVPSVSPVIVIPNLSR